MLHLLQSWLTSSRLYRCCSMLGFLLAGWLTGQAIPNSNHSGLLVISLSHTSGLWPPRCFFICYMLGFKMFTRHLKNKHEPRHLPTAVLFRVLRKSRNGDSRTRPNTTDSTAEAGSTGRGCELRSATTTHNETEDYKARHTGQDCTNEMLLLVRMSYGGWDPGSSIISWHEKQRVLIMYAEEGGTGRKGAGRNFPSNMYYAKWWLKKKKA